MKAEFLEQYVQLGSLKPGQVAVSKDRKDIFICLWVPNEERNFSHDAIVRLNNLNDQYVDKLDLKAPVKKLVEGDRFVFEI